jgi:hypothetical protein
MALKICLANQVAEGVLELVAFDRRRHEKIHLQLDLMYVVDEVQEERGANWGQKLLLA